MTMATAEPIQGVNVKHVYGADLGPQLALWRPLMPSPEPRHFQPIETKGTRCKPKGGMWTSTPLDDGRICGWADWCAGEDWSTGTFDRWLLTPEPDCRVAEVDTLDDLVALHAVYGKSRDWESTIEPGRMFTDHWLDFEAMAQDFAGMHLTDEGQWATRLSHPMDLYGWDCESTCWFRWAFVKVEHDGLAEVVGRAYNFEED